MKLYHGTNVEFDEIDLSQSNKYKDFGRGFYVTDIRSQALDYLLDRYEEGSFTLEELARELEYKDLNSQYFFGTEKAVSLLKRVK